MGLIYYKGEPYGKIEDDELQFYAVEGDIEELPEGGKELEKIPVLNDDGTQKTTEEGKKLWKVNIPMSYVIQNANILTETDAEYIINKQAVDKIELSNGTRSVFNNVNGNFIASGFRVVRAATKEEAINKITPEDLYTSIKVGKSNFSTNYSLSSSSFIQSYNNSVFTDGHGNTNLKQTSFSLDTTYVGVAFIFDSISEDSKTKAWGYAAAFDKNKELLSVSPLINEVGSEFFALLTLTDTEKEYALGLTDTYEYISEETYKNEVSST